MADSGPAMNADEAVIHLKCGRALRAAVRPDGSVGFALMAGEEVERITFTSRDAPQTTWPTHLVAQARMPAHKPALGDRTAWLRDRYGRVRR